MLSNDSSVAESAKRELEILKKTELFERELISLSDEIERIQEEQKKISSDLSKELTMISVKFRSLYNTYIQNKK